MRPFLFVLLICSALVAYGQQHDVKPADAIKNLAFMKGDWSGKQDFNTNGGPAMSGDATNHIDDAIGGRYLCEMLSTTMPGRKPTDTRHFIGWDPKGEVYRAWWFTDTSSSPLEFEGVLSGSKLVLTSKPVNTGGATGAVLRATYEGSADKLTYTLEMKDGDSWRRLFTTTYGRKG